MKIELSTKSLKDAVTTASLFSSATNPIAAQRNILVEVKDNVLTLTGAETSFCRITVEDDTLTVSEDGQFLIDPKVIGDILAKADADTVSIETNGTILKIKAGVASYKLNSMNPKDYPNLAMKLENAAKFNMTAESIIRIIDNTAFAAEQKKDIRPILKGVNFQMKGGVLTNWATDSYRLAKLVTTGTGDGEMNVTVPVKVLNLLKKCLAKADGTESVEMELNTRQVIFRTGSVVIGSPLLDGGYPEVERLIPKGNMGTMKISRSTLLAALNRGMFLTTDGMSIFTLEMEPGKIVLSNTSQEIGEFNEELAADYSGSPLTISFSGVYLKDAVNVMGEDVVITFVGEMRPFIIETEGESDKLQLVLPVRRYN